MESFITFYDFMILYFQLFLSSTWGFMNTVTASHTSNKYRPRDEVSADHALLIWFHDKSRQYLMINLNTSLKPENNLNGLLKIQELIAAPVLKPETNDSILLKNFRLLLCSPFH